MSDVPVTDALLLAAGRGDQAAFAAFYDLTAPSVFGLLRTGMGDAGAAEQAVEEVYLQVWRRAPAFDPARRSARATVLLVARRLVIGRVREPFGMSPGQVGTSDP